MMQGTVEDIEGLVAAPGAADKFFPRTEHVAERHDAEDIRIERRSVEGVDRGFTDDAMTFRDYCHHEPPARSRSSPALVAEDAADRCAYCQSAVTIVGLPFEIDHVNRESLGTRLQWPSWLSMACIGSILTLEMSRVKK